MRCTKTVRELDKMQTTCPYCDIEATALVLPDSANREQVTWCTAGHVVISSQAGVLPADVLAMCRTMNSAAPTVGYPTHLVVCARTVYNGLSSAT